MASSDVLDEIHTIAKLDALDPAAYADALAAELAALAPPASIADLAARDDQLRAALAAVDAFTERAMKIRLDRVLAADTSIPPATRKVFAGTITSYAGDLGRLHARVRDAAARVDALGSGNTADAVVEAARAVLALRDGLRAAVLDQVRALAAAALPLAVARAKDRSTDDAVRLTWSAARRDLETIADRPDAIAAARHADRLAAWPALLDEPEPEPERTFGELLELD